MNHRPTILLFDLDGTLVSTGGAGRRAIERAFKERHGSAEPVAAINFAGMTDRAIARAGLEALGIASTAAAIKGLLDAYLVCLDAEIAAARRFGVLAGVTALLDAAAERSGIAVGLGTGNIRAGAKRKLDHAGLWWRFTFGGFADDSESRPELIRIAAERGAEQLRAPLRVCRVIVIGDTPLDIDAARQNSFQVLAVATGPISRADLEPHRPDHLADSLADAAARTWLLHGSK